MCQFCVQHGDGRSWYLEASSYAYDLERDLRRRRYMVDFVQEFAGNRESALTNLARLERLPAPLRDLGRAVASSRMKKLHYGQPVPIEECDEIFGIATSIVRLPCPCRYWAGTHDEGYCLAITTKPIDAVLDEAFRDYDVGPDTSKFQYMTRAEAMELLRRSEEEGLMHSVWTFLTPFIGAICNCSLEAGCMAMRITVEHATPIMFKGHNVATCDAEACVGCAECVERCPFGALAVGPRTRRATVDPKACYGCGVCRSACERHALSLTPRQGAPIASLVTTGVGGLRPRTPDRAREAAAQ
jgi:ferredoxin